MTDGLSEADGVMRVEEWSDDEGVMREEVWCDDGGMRVKVWRVHRPRKRR